MRKTMLFSVVYAAVGLAATFADAFAQSKEILIRDNASAEDIKNALTARGTSRGIAAATTLERPASSANAPYAVGAGQAPSSGGAAAPAGSPPATDQRVLVSFPVLFEYDSADLTPAARRFLDILGEALSSQELAARQFLIEGHTDAAGAEIYNLALSERRAKSVHGYLVTRYGIDASRLQPVGKGEVDLFDPRRPLSAENRRVRLVPIDG